MGVENGDDKNAVIQKGIEAMENFSDKSKCDGSWRIKH